MDPHQNLGELFGHMSLQFATLTDRIGHQTEALNVSIGMHTESIQSHGVAAFVPVFGGTNTSDYKPWIMTVDKYVFYTI